MNADPAIQLRLLDLQAIDSALSRLAHRRATLAELAEIERGDQRLAELRDDVVRAETQISDIDREQRRLEADVEQVRQRAARDQQRMASGAVGSPKELEGLQHEVDTLSRRQSDLEDHVLDVMERHETVDGQLAALRAQVSEATAQRDRAVAGRDSAYAGMDVEEERARTERQDVVAEMPDELLALYERIRQSAGGVGAAALRQRRCEGCRLELAGTELTAARNAPPDAVLRCENCRRILVRTPESGL
ncbi:MAG TPA: C4-type zinc ribbon domain-containing protein [Mycobacteriales bacterium]|nr:C4-type zinc ribbon domain-containing protein [Mycobacteriales bacterium]